MLFLPPCRVSTQWLSSSKWLARGGRPSRYVNFCAMHSQCLPKTVNQAANIHCRLGRANLSSSFFANIRTPAWRGILFKAILRIPPQFTCPLFTYSLLQCPWCLSLSERPPPMSWLWNMIQSANLGAIGCATQESLGGTRRHGLTLANRGKRNSLLQCVCGR